MDDKYSTRELDEFSVDAEELYERHRIYVDKGQTLIRIDKFLCDRIENASRNQIQKAAIKNAMNLANRAIKRLSNIALAKVNKVILQLMAVVGG